MFTSFSRSPCSDCENVMDNFEGLAAAAIHYGSPAHCSAPPLRAAFRLPRLPRDVEAVTRPRMALLPAKWERASEAGAEYNFALEQIDVANVKVEAEEAQDEPIEVEENRGTQLGAQFSALSVAPPAAVNRPRGPGRPKGSRSKPRVEPRYDVSAPPEREKARKASARIAAMTR